MAPLVYWLVVIGGLLAAYRVLEHGVLARAGCLWLAVVAGTAVGQAAAAARLRLWLLLTALPVVTMAASYLVLCVLTLTGASKLLDSPGLDVELGVMAFVPAMLCGYASLGERTGLAALWFPSSLWMIAILDSAEEAGVAGAATWALLSVLAAVFLAFLLVHEARRIALWQTRSTRRLSVAGPAAVLRRSPSGVVARVVWLAATAAATLAITAWVAPHLWHKDRTDPRALDDANAQAAAGDPGGAPCCPDPDVEEVDPQRFREYLPLLTPRSDRARVAPANRCVACSNGVPVEPSQVELSSLAAGDGGTGAAVGARASGASSSVAAASSPETVANPMAPLPSLATDDEPSAPARSIPRASPSVAMAPGGSVHPVGGAPLRATGSLDIRALPWLLALVASALLVQLLLRPLRRLVTLRHLRRPLWPEPVDQRVSNLWQLVLVGLRDAGWRARPGEPADELAQRVRMPGVDTCAQVLDRTRHGVRVDAADLDAMTNAAGEVYRASRERVGWLARALSWLRWPLV